MKCEDLIGRIFGELTVLKLSHKRIRSSGNQRTYYWLCRCSCGVEKAISAQKLKVGQKSCGCQRANKLPFGQAFLNKLLYKYKKDAKARGLCFKLSKKHFTTLIKEDCAYCGAAPSERYKHSNFNGQFPTNGIDRINSEKGYITANVISCCFQCNRAKHTMNFEDFKSWVEALSRKLLSDT